MPLTPQQPATHNQQPPPSSSGQALIFILFTMIILVFVVLWNFDLHKSLRVKMIAQNGGDAAALAAARWQGITLNLLGDLNVVNALALSANDTATLASVSNLQARLALAGPMIGFMAAQQAAKNNGVYPHEPFTHMIRAHAQIVRTQYTNSFGTDGALQFPEPYVGAWGDYADMLELVAEEGVAAGPENARFFSDYVGDHILLNPAFYEAIAGRSWCWFFHQAPGLLENYTDWSWWPALPTIDAGEYINSEIFGLGLMRRSTAVGNLVDDDTLFNTAAARGLGLTFTPTGMDTTATWYCYGELWTPWFAMDQNVPNAFPAAGPVRPQYDYAGADAAVRVVTRSSRVTPGPGGQTASNFITWTAAAKPFGFLGTDDPPTRIPLLLPAFHDVRLIPMDASSAANTGGFDPEWRHFIEVDLPHYLNTGELCDSFYCNQLAQWEIPAFREDGLAWLELNAAQCIAGGPGPGPGGGSRKGH